MSNEFNSALCKLIHCRIQETPQQRITFAEYMDCVLYHPQQGYYATGGSQIGSQGDFFTSPHLGADFGELLAEQFVEMWEILGYPTPFTLVEMGAGQGLLAADILRYLSGRHQACFQALEYIIVEKATGMIAQQQQVLEKLQLDLPGKYRWATLEEIAEESIVGCCFSNELVDAMPVHQIILQKNQLWEIYVTAGSSEDEFVEVTGELSTPHLAEYFDWVKVKIPSAAYPEGYRTEVNLAALDWMKTLAQKLQRGYLLTIDYGYESDRFYSPRRDRGTLQCYYRHRHHDNPYLYIGHQDITAHVDFTALERQGELCGLHKVGFTQQGLFLMALGLGDRIAALSHSSDTNIQQVLRRRQALHQLIDPTGLGGFGVLIQSKGEVEGENKRSLKGLSVPKR